MTNKQAIKTIRTAMAKVAWDEPLKYQTAFTKAVHSLKDFDWRPVEKKLPEEGGWYLCTVRYVNGQKSVLLGYFEINPDPGFIFGCEADAIAWMPLPKAY